MRYCPNCGTQVAGPGRFCSGCGSSLQPGAKGASSGAVQVPPDTHPYKLAIWLSILLGWWAGALVNRQYAKAVLIAIVTVALIFAGLWPVLFIGWIVGWFDTGRVSGRLLAGVPVEPFQFF